MNPTPATPNHALQRTGATVVRDYTLAWTGRGDGLSLVASDELHDMVHTSPERAWPIILSLIRE